MTAHHGFENVVCDFGFEGVILEFGRPFMASRRFFELFLHFVSHL